VTLSANGRSPKVHGFGQTGVLIVGAPGPGRGKRDLAHGERDDCLVAFSFGIEQPRGVFEHGKVHSRRVDSRLIGGDRRRDLIKFTAQGRGDVHQIRLEQNKNIVNAISKLSKMLSCLIIRKG
jgi:hypothetical protein